MIARMALCLLLVAGGVTLAGCESVSDAARLANTLRKACADGHC